MDAPSRIRRAWPADAPVLAALERRCFGDPWSAASFREALAQPGVVGFVSEVEGELVAYVLARETVGTGEILNLAVAPDLRRRGTAAALLAAALEAIGARGGREVFLEVRESNAAALGLYRAAGFAQVGRREGYYREPVEAALVLRRDLAPVEQFD